MNKSNLVLIFVDSCCLVEKGLFCPQGELWKAFLFWLPEFKRRGLGRNAFYRGLEEYFPRKEGVFENLTLREEELWEFLQEEDLSRVYLISDGKRVKIGISFNPTRRLEILQVGCSSELSILATFPGGRSEEKFLHETFQDKKERGEWFNLREEDVIKIFAYFSEKELK